MHKQMSQYILRAFSFLWMFIIFLDYWYYHQEFSFKSFQFFQYSGLVFFLILLGGGVFVVLTKLGTETKPFILSNGLGIGLLFFLVSLIITVFHIQLIDLPLKLNPFVLLGNIVFVVGVTYLILTSCYALGNFLFDYLFSITFIKLETTIISLALGIIALSISLFFLGMVKLLQPFVIGPLLLGILLIFRKRVQFFLNYSLINKIQIRGHVNYLGFGSFYLMIIFISLIFVQNIRPFPYGFDALVIYMNLPNLIGETNGLVTGFSPYYWSLFVSLGFILLDSLPIVISLSVLGAILSGYTIFSISRKWINDNYALLATSLFFTLPLVNFQAYKDVKTDLGLLFFMLIVILVLLNYIESKYPETFKEKLLIVNKKAKRRIKKTKKTNPVKEIIPIAKTPKGWLSNRFQKDNEYIILIGLLS